MKVWIDIRTNGLADAAHKAILAIPGVSPSGHPGPYTLRLGVPAARATAIAAAIEAVVAAHEEVEKEEPKQTVCEPECSYTPIKLPDVVTVNSGGRKDKGAEVMLPSGRIGTVTKAYESWRDGKPRTVLLVRISASKLKTVLASDVKTVSAAK